jgi:acyl carrier protein phosphodiesterase
MTGNLMADFLKHVELSEQPESILRGIENHRATDKFTDSHALVLGLKEHFNPDFRRFVPIMLDVSFDHMLAKHWMTFHKQPLTQFTQQAYVKLENASQHMPDIMINRIRGMAKRDWLGAYIELETVEKTLLAISNRIRFENSLDMSFSEVEDQYDRIEESFLSFFPELIDHIDQLGIEATK